MAETKLMMQREVGLIECNEYEFTSLYNAIKRLQKNGAEKVLLMEYGILGIKYELESDEEYSERIKLFETHKQREHQKDLVEYARLKAKLFPE